MNENAEFNAMKIWLIVIIIVMRFLYINHWVALDNQNNDAVFLIRFKHFFSVHFLFAPKIHKYTRMQYANHRIGIKRNE